VTQTIVHDYPPLMEEINAEFNTLNRSVIYSWGDIIYNPMRMYIPPSLMVHEAVHGRRQQPNPGVWWVLYLANKSFRFLEEAAAHRAEYQYLCGNGSRLQRRSARACVSKRLCGGLYGHMVKRRQANNILDMPEHEFDRIMSAAVEEKGDE